MIQKNGVEAEEDSVIPFAQFLPLGVSTPAVYCIVD